VTVEDHSVPAAAVTDRNGETALRARAHIELSDLAIAFAGESIFSNLTLSIAEGEFVCLLGPSGCGKSTLIRLIGGLMQPTAGRVRVAGQPPGATRATLAYVFQSPRLVPWRTALDNVTLAIELRSPAVGKVERRTRALELLHMVGLGADVGKYPAMLSGGERQRVAIARALAVEPGTILMDEPFSALDPETRRRMRVDLIALWQLTRKTVVFVTHDLDEALELADRIVVFSGKPTRILDSVAVEVDRPRAATESVPLRAAKARLLQLFAEPAGRPGGLPEDLPGGKDA
jgi:NitT/TauT family transport system ATP-binding protein